MALNKYMHPRNIYKNPPDFAKLAGSYEEFASIVKKDVTGKVSINFKDPHSLRLLTKYLLKSDFNLDVSIPEDRLVPTLPLRLNYILWIEDLLCLSQRNENICGLDIGTGACAIYPLLAAIKNKWHMVGTETDVESIMKAQENVQRNNLQELIKLVKNPTTSLLKHVFANEDVNKFDFSMCNPPFYSTIQELYESRSPARLPPKNGFTGSPQELITEGGELNFCRNMINESRDYENKVLIFTTMVGHKYNLRELVQDLKTKGIQHTTTEFCQGRVTRWGLAWTYQDYDFTQLASTKEKRNKKNVPIIFSIPELPDSPYDINTVSIRLKLILQELKIEHKILNKRGHNLSLDIKAVQNTWSNQRRKRRLMKQLENNNTKKRKLNDVENKVSETTTPVNDIGNEILELEKPAGQPTSHNIKDAERNYNETTSVDSLEKKNITNAHEFKEQTIDPTKTPNASNSTSLHDDKIEDHNKNQKITENDLESSCSDINTSIASEPVVHAFLKIMKKRYEILLESEFLDGSAGKEGLHQIIQYIKNNWK